MESDLEKGNSLIEKIWRLSSVIAVAKKIHSSTDIDHIILSFLDSAMVELNSDKGNLFFFKKDFTYLNISHNKNSAKNLYISGSFEEWLANKTLKTDDFKVMDEGELKQFSEQFNNNPDILMKRMISIHLTEEKGEKIGVLQLFWEDQRDYNESDLVFLKEISGFASLAIQKAKYHTDSLKKVRMEQEMIVASDIQKKVLPAKFPQIKMLNIAGYFLPCYETAGDYYHFFQNENDHFFILMDVSGKGVGAAMVANLIHSFFLLQLSYFKNLSDLAVSLSEYLYATLEGEKYATGVIIKLSSDQKMSFISAGHPSIIKVGADTPQKLTSTSPPFGLLPGMDFFEENLIMNPGDLICIYSDGYNETMNLEEEEFGENRIEQILDKSKGKILQEIIQDINISVDKFKGDFPNQDDKTLLLIKKKY